ncbi:head GIN domain-containing protein [Aquimarina sp. I32.4]|uniref:head GIN domain-containing protein n=1 Tax=Aquimarina sp. I32.4 TaxID=2053903 RepID=UPI000CDE6904|nr:head GIN domain-containing protein [Aquimarina sp. I32.4]
MKKITVLLAFLCAITIQAQDIITKNISDFSELKVFDKVEVLLIKSDDNKVVVSGVNRKDIDIVTKNEVLKIKMSLNNLWDNDNTKVVVYYTDISKIDVNEGAKVKSKERIESDDLDLRAQEGASIIATINADELYVKAVTGGELILKGTVREQEVIVKAGGQFMAKDLKTENTVVSISAGGRASINASTYVKANTAAGGTVRIYGNPKEMDTQKFLGGKIIEVN